MENWFAGFAERHPVFDGGCNRSGRGGALSPPGFPGAMKVSTGSCRGRPMCRPVGVFWAGACPGGHIGPPLRGGGGVPNQRKIGAKPDLANGAGQSPPPTGGRGSSGNHLGQQRTAERLRRGREEWVKIGSWIIPIVSINAGQSLSHGEAVTAPFAQRSLRDGGYVVPRRFAPRNDSPDPVSFRGGPTGRCGNPSFYDGRGTGVRAAEVVGPYGRSTEVPATGRCGHRPLRVVAESCRDHPGSALSAERVAGQIRFLPDDLRVQHGVQGSEVCGRLRPCSRWHYLN